MDYAQDEGNSVPDLHLENPLVPRNCIFFLCVLNRYTNETFGTFPADVLHIIVLNNAIIGKFTGVCVRCYQWHEGVKNNLFHPGNWHDSNYADLLEHKFSAHVLKAQISDSGGVIGKVFRHAGHNVCHDIKVGAKCTKKAESYVVLFRKRKRIRSSTIAYSYAVACTISAFTLPIVLGVTVPIIGGVVSVGTGLAHGVATPFIEAGKVIGHGIDPTFDTKHYKELHENSLWTCCKQEGPWALPCTTCPRYIADANNWWNL